MSDGMFDGIFDGIFDGTFDGTFDGILDGIFDAPSAFAGVLREKKKRAVREAQAVLAARPFGR